MFTNVCIFVCVLFAAGKKPIFQCLRGRHDLWWLDQLQPVSGWSKFKFSRRFSNQRELRKHPDCWSWIRTCFRSQEEITAVFVIPKILSTSISTSIGSYLSRGESQSKKCDKATSVEQSLYHLCQGTRFSFFIHPCQLLSLFVSILLSVKWSCCPGLISCFLS